MPGSGRVGPVVYVDALLAGMPPPVRDARARGDRRARARGRERRGARRAASARRSSRSSARSRSRRTTATSSRRAGTRRAPGPRSTSTRRSRPASTRTGRTWGSREGARSTSSSSARARAAASSPASWRSAAATSLLLETGPHLTAADFTRWEAKATHDLFWPIRFAPPPGRRRGRVPRRPLRRRHDDDQHEGRAARARAGRREVAPGDRPDERRRRAVRASPTSTPYYDRVEQRARRARAQRLAEVRAHGRAGLPGARRTSSSPCTSYTDANCMHCGSCLQGCPTNAGKSTDEHVHRRRLGARAARAARGRGGRRASWSRTARRRASSTSTRHGERHDGARGRGRRRRRRAEHAADPRSAPGSTRRRSASTSACTRCGSSTGCFDEPQDAHMVYPIIVALHGLPARRGRRLRDRGDDDPGPDLVRDDAARRGRAALGAAPRRGRAQVPALGRRAGDGERREQRRGGRRRGRRASGSTSTSSRASSSGSTPRSTSAARCCEAAGATQVCWTGLASTHVQGSCRMGDDPERSAVDRNGEVHGVEAPLRRRRLADPAHALGQPVADDHGARDAARRPPPRRPGRVSPVKAALLTEYHRPLELVDRPEPEPVAAARRRRPGRRRRRVRDRPARDRRADGAGRPAPAGRARPRERRLGARGRRRRHGGRGRRRRARLPGVQLRALRRLPPRAWTCTASATSSRA